MELTVVQGDKIRYTSAAGTRVAVVKSITIRPTARPNHSIAWLNLTVPAQGSAKFSSDVSIPADSGSLKAFKVEIA
jgi:hypothetical protein